MPSTFNDRPRSVRRPAEDADTGSFDAARSLVGTQQSPAPAAPAPSAGGNGLIRGGWSAGQQEMDRTASYAQSFKWENNFQAVKFLDDAPYANYRRHWIERMTQQGPKKRPYTCLESVGKECPLCDIGDKPQAVSSFNVALLGDDGVPVLKSLDVGPRLFGTFKSFSNDPMVGALSSGYWLLSRTGKGGSTQYNILPKSESDLKDMGHILPTDSALDRLGKYDSSIVQIPAISDLQEVAQEIQDY